MRTILDEKQTAFFTNNGFIELEIAHEFPQQPERDQWRRDPKLQDFLVRKLGPFALILTGKTQLRLACDQFLSQETRPKKASPLKELFCIQGLALGIAITNQPMVPARRSPLGILPLPSKQENILFFRPDLILDWPHVASDIYLALYALPSAVYIHNLKDPATHGLKQFGYHFGDVLKNDTHPLIL